eukprot:TRINITY_DN71295_c0_g1_i1.p1 TRINITY_DN71295_c0_g1~~TRINITY_DN71295_c0_g1_i1.p1  ORF type:complete len:348 (-),score=52.42 TRINITY_DN71295_c0_g1_i1:140-1183(-)
MASEESSELIPKRLSSGGFGPRSSGQVQDATGFIPSYATSMLSSRIANTEMMQWQEGAGSGELEGVDEESPQEKAQPKPYKPELVPYLNMDKRPFYPAALMLSILWSALMTKLQSWAVAELFGDILGWHVSFFFFSLYSVTIYCFAYTSLCNPGMLREDLYKKWLSEGGDLPQRCAKHWLYRRPIMRLNHYCRWTTNVIALNNHREFMIMLGGFCTIACLDTVIDIVLVPLHLFVGTWTGQFFLTLHLAYSAFLARSTIPLLRQHVGHIRRNELVQEWKRDDFYVIKDKLTGEVKWVPDLDTETYNEYFDEFTYDPTRNKWDKGSPEANCWTFWFTPRWPEDQVGEF